MLSPTVPPDRHARGTRAVVAAARRDARGRLLAACCGAVVTVLALAACGTTGASSASNYSGARKEVADAITSFQTDATGLNPGKVCKLLAAVAIRRLDEKSAKCGRAIKTALEQVDTFTIAVDEIEVKGASATAKVKSTVYGKEEPGTISLVKEGGSWKISSLG
ncbi:MAG: nuclear transport factor 2 family protein [Solirubrobacteraceae bacterium]